MSRRQQLLAIAAELFAARGFHGVSMAELGAACGISGPALYRHFASKDAMLAEMLVSISEELLREGRARTAAAERPDEAVVALVRWHTDFALHNRPLIVLQDRDWELLPEEARERVRALQRSYVELWVDALRGAQPGLERDRARAMCHATFGLLNSTPRSTYLEEPQMAVLLEQMATAALGLPSPGLDRLDRRGGLDLPGGVGHAPVASLGAMTLLDQPIARLDGTPATLGEITQGQVALVVNVASKCGLTSQYAALERLQETYGARGFTVVGVPCNQFGGQEPGSADEIAEFCSSTYGVTFPMTEKVDVNGEDRHPIFSELTLVPVTGGDPGDISWNFEKFLLDRDGRPLGRFAPGTAPDDPSVVQAIEYALSV